jgi:hypothetical protein
LTCGPRPVTFNDEACREIAQHIESECPHWIVIFGVYTKQFVAFPLFDAPPGTTVTGFYPDSLIKRLRNIEQRLRNPRQEGGHAADDS